jgi:hypothetical protein
MKPNWKWVAAVVAVLFASGCSEDLFSPDSTSILGRLLDPDDNGILGIQVGVVYQTASLSPGPPGAVAAPEAAQAANFGAVYPNPASIGGGPTVKIPILATGPTAISVEIRASFGGVPGTVKTLFTGTVAQDTVLVWDGRVSGVAVPNGRYDLRLGGAGVSPVQEQVLLINRSVGEMENLGLYGFNTTSDTNGEYLVEDLAVGTRFTATNSSGSVLGSQFVVNQVVVVFRDIERGQYRGDQTTVPIGPGDQVEITTRLTPLFASPLSPTEIP